MNIFIDCGAYNGDSIEEFKNWRKVAFPDKEDWKLYAFEPNPKFKDYWANQAHENLTFCDDAVWIKNEVIDFLVDQESEPLGSSLMMSKRNVANAPKIKVTAFDFSQWLTQFKDDFVVLKMDIEGAEFPVLNKMMADGTDKIPYVMMVEFHPNKIPEYSTQDKNGIIRKLQKHGVNIKEWH
jgi:FkbM family methyltransferase